MRQLVFSYVAIERGVLYMYEHGFLNCPGLAVDLLVHNVKLVRVQWMSCSGTMLMYWGWGF